MNRINYGQQDIRDEDIESVIKTLKSEFLTQGPTVERFESLFAEFVGAPFAVAVSNATCALHLAALALGVQKQDKVLTSSNTFVASANCVRYCEGEVEFVDIDPNSFCMDLNKLEEKLNSSPQGTYKGIIPVSFAGYPIDSEKLERIAKNYNLWIIEDACHAPGAQFQSSDDTWKKTGSGEYADLTVFSFHPVKHIATGEGGMITTRNKELYDQLKLLRSHGIVRNADKLTQNEGGWYYEMQLLGYNYRLPDLNCALGISQLARMDGNLKNRKAIADRYTQELSELPITVPHYPVNILHAFHLYVVQVENRKSLYDFLKTKNIFTQVHYIPVHHQPYYIERYGTQNLENTDTYYNRCLSLPMFHSMSDADQSHVIKEIKAFYAQ